MSKPNPELAAEVIYLIEQGKTSTEIMAALGVTKGQVAGIRNRARVAARDEIEGLSRVEDEAILRAVKMRAKGASPKQVAYMMGRSVPWVNNKTHAVFKDDLHYSGDKPGAVRGAYW